MSNMDKTAPPHAPAEWGVAEAKNRFSELITRALTEGPQRVRRRDEEVVVVSAAEFDRLKPPEKSFVRFLLEDGPDFEGVDLERDRSPMREFDW